MRPEGEQARPTGTLDSSGQVTMKYSNVTFPMKLHLISLDNISRSLSKQLYLLKTISLFFFH